MLAKDSARAIRQSERCKYAAPANDTARATGKTGKRNRNIPEERTISALLASQTMLTTRQSGVLRHARKMGNAKANGSGPKNCQKPAWARSIPANSGNKSTCQSERRPLAPVSASTRPRVNEFISLGANQCSKNGNTGSWVHNALRA